MDGVCRGGSPKGGVQTQKKWGHREPLPESWSPERWGSEGWGAQNFALFPSPANPFSLFCLCRGVFSSNFGGVFEAPGPSNVRLGSRAVV